MSLIVQPYVPNKDAPRTDVLQIASKVEVNAVDYQTRLRRAGLTDEPPVDDGFVSPS